MTMNPTVAWSAEVVGVTGSAKWLVSRLLQTLTPYRI